MKMVLDDTADLNAITAYRAGEVRIRDQVHATQCLILARRVERHGIPGTIAELNRETLQPVIESAVEILILGTGERQCFPPPETLDSLMQARIGYEIMDNAAACRTFNILLAEGRRAGLLLLRDPA